MISSKFYLWIIKLTVFFLLFIFRTCISQKISHVSPCFYPIYRESQACGVQDFSLLDGFFCDPDSTISMSEMQLIGENLRRIYRSKQDKCVCNDSISQQCWFKFGFAFMRELTPIEGGVTDFHSYDHCPFNATLSRNSSTFKPMTTESIINYGTNFARIIRERWNMAECDEDFLVLVVQRRPQTLSRSGIQLRPFIFLSYGSLVHEKLISMEAFHSNKFPNDSLQTIVESENNHLQDGYPLNRVLISLISRIVNILKEAEELPRHPKPKHHVPGWAWCAFGACAVLCIFMTIGLCWVRSTTRRGSQRGKPGIMAANSRPWKAGFGDEQQPTQNYNVNLVQMLFPHPRTPANV